MGFRTKIDITDDRLITNGSKSSNNMMNIDLTTSAETKSYLDLDFTFISNEEETIFRFENNEFSVTKNDSPQIKEGNITDSFELKPMFFKTDDDTKFSGVSMFFMINEVIKIENNIFSGNGFTDEYVEYKAFSKNKKEISKDSVTITKYEITTESILAEDNKIELNFGGNHKSALEGGFTIINGVKEGEDSTIKINENGIWNFHPGIKTEKIILPKTSSLNKNVGSISWDNEYLYINTEVGPKKIKLEEIK